MSCANSNDSYLAQRDSFFHTCWLKLKQRRPDIWQDMTEVELDVAGWPVQAAVENEPDSPEIDPNEPIVL